MLLPLSRGASASLFRIAQKQPFSLKGIVFPGVGGFGGTVETDVMNWPSQKDHSEASIKDVHKLWTKIKQAVFFHRPGFGLINACQKHWSRSELFYCSTYTADHLLY